MEVSSETKASIEAMFGIMDDANANDNDNTKTSSNQDNNVTEEKSTAKNPNDIIPQLEEGVVTYGDLETAVKVLNAVSNLIPSKKNKKRKHKQTKEEAAKEEEIGFEKYQHTNLRPLRKAIAQCMNIHQRRMYEGKSEDQYYDDKTKARSLKRQKMAEREMQRKYIADTALRRGRIERLKQKQSEAKDEEIAKLQQRMMIPDGHVETHSHNAPKLLLPASNENDTNNSNKNSEEPNSGNEGKGLETIVETVTDMTDEPTILPKLRSCYACKVRYRELHQFYDQLCPDCAKLNWEKRHQTANLKGKVAVVTGSRVKIGFQTCLKLLRAGATVVATTRFPNSAAEAYQKEPDFDQFKDRLQIYGLDLRDVTGIEAFCRFLKLTYSESGIDMLINNACQTIRRPTGYYLPLCQKEESLWKGADATHKKLLSGCREFERIRRQLQLGSGSNGSQGSDGTHPASILGGDPSPAVPMPSNETKIEEAKTPDNDQQGSGSSTALVVQKRTNGTLTTTANAPFESNGVAHSAAMSQMILLPEDVGVSDEVLPPGVTDINGQQLDLRTTNSWRLKMEEVSTPEVMECMFINAIAPFVLNSRLKPLMKVPHSHEDRFIINVSAMEGKFYRYKMANHPHTNMAKAALNMMTRTSAEDLAKNSRIFMNSVDTGWINDENPLERATKTAATNLFQTPIDEIDAAARILDPIFSGMNDPTTPKDYGKFLKDYKETEW
mmetsp:Transcript_8792/g.21050  ORF Transcript_8792/g.21050 Transcript_8792/m.21050 type:complete len:723 (-) Transcript_8792:313-2481(-)|eukprot:CAMPEP_0113644608 /NCGR_PEP_ID=MMETSP0017_2-20120614/23479_1 /TAXON_ID=2856 /ORGANISM="Cylindrotheca closterium" /LENGTH=722 /DNA_ID=CAMNT_0000556231 /DNA_START=55 /DNA_END=2223 /DNA_ORIENTATION=+ /assembly_acc=CAM_ASM_000147